MTAPGGGLDGGSEHPAGESGGLKRLRVIGIVWLVAWIFLAEWASVILATAWPYVQLPAQLLLIIAVPGIVFRAFDLALLWRFGKRLGGWRRWAARIVAIVLGVGGAAFLSQIMGQRSMGSFERALTPLVERIHASMNSPCLSATSHLQGEPLTAYLEMSNSPARHAELHFDSNRFVLALPGRSIDIDGSTVFYDSATRRWRKVHNDALASTGELASLTQGLSLCRIALR